MREAYGQMEKINAYRILAWNPLSKCLENWKTL
jgi:hypothetical protein